MNKHISQQARWYLNGLQKNFSCTEESAEPTAMKELLDAELIILNRGYLAGTRYYTITKKGLEA